MSDPNRLPQLGTRRAPATAPSASRARSRAGGPDPPERRVAGSSSRNPSLPLLRGGGPIRSAHATVEDHLVAIAAAKAGAAGGADGARRVAQAAKAVGDSLIDRSMANAWVTSRSRQRNELVTVAAECDAAFEHAKRRLFEVEEQARTSGVPSATRSYGGFHDALARYRRDLHKIVAEHAGTRTCKGESAVDGVRALRSKVAALQRGGGSAASAASSAAAETVARELHAVGKHTATVATQLAEEERAAMVELGATLRTAEPATPGADSIDDVFHPAWFYADMMFESKGDFAAELSSAEPPTVATIESWGLEPLFRVVQRHARDRLHLHEQALGASAITVATSAVSTRASTASSALADARKTIQRAKGRMLTNIEECGLTPSELSLLCYADQTGWSTHHGKALQLLLQRHRGQQLDLRGTTAQSSCPGAEKLLAVCRAVAEVVQAIATESSVRRDVRQVANTAAVELAVQLESLASTSTAAFAQEQANREATEETAQRHRELDVRREQHNAHKVALQAEEVAAEQARRTEQAALERRQRAIQEARRDQVQAWQEQQEKAKRSAVEESVAQDYAARQAFKAGAGERAERVELRRALTDARLLAARQREEAAATAVKEQEAQAARIREEVERALGVEADPARVLETTASAGARKEARDTPELGPFQRPLPGYTDKAIRADPRTRLAGALAAAGVGETAYARAMLAGLGRVAPVMRPSGGNPLAFNP